VDPFIKLSAPETRQFWQIPVLWEDAHLLALDKPSELLTSPDRYDTQRPNLMRLLQRDIARGAPWARQRGLSYLANAHRLDFGTSGVLLLAKEKAALVALANQFGTDRPLKRYLALVEGSPAKDAWEVEARLAPHPTRPGMMRVDAKLGKHARTLFEATERFSGYTLVTCRLLTGRTHQIRVHLRHAGFPVVGDGLYGGRPLLLSKLKTDYRFKRNQEERPLIARAALHAEELALQHPTTGAEVMIRAPWPKDLVVAIKYLRRYAGLP
jgi:RluA family pseudouridine synthase